ncbi:MAG: hypothetical protein MI725_15285 [Pirellulales bacterium]|nr:hypothetical protein [Pirellulales bacterium]
MAKELAKQNGKIFFAKEGVKTSLPAVPKFSGEKLFLRNAARAQLSLPVWDSERKELRVDGQLVKRFRTPAPNQETVISAFEEESWPARIDDPLPPAAEQNCRRRLIDTIKCLNRSQVHSLLRFRGDGTGRGILWDRSA